MAEAMPETRTDRADALALLAAEVATEHAEALSDPDQCLWGV